MVWVVIAVTAGFLLCYILYVLFSSSGSSFTGNSISDFIAAPQSEDAGLHLNRQSHQRTYKYGYKDPGKQILVIYGTEYGASEEVARKLTDRLMHIPSDSLAFHWQPRLLNAKYYDRTDLSKEQLLLIVISTSGDGVPPTDARQFVEHLNVHQPHLTHLKFAVLALGDSSYPHYCRAGIMVDQRLHYLGASRILPRTDVDAEDWSVITDWLEKIIACVQSTEIAVAPCHDYLLPIAENEPGGFEGYDRHTPFMAMLKVKRLLTFVESAADKEIIHCEFDVSGSNIEWCPGDALGIYATNCPDDILAVLDSIGLSSTHIVSRPRWAYGSSSGGHSGCCALGDALAKYYDLKHVSADLLRFLSSEYQGSDAARNIELLLEAGTSKENAQLHAYIGCREVRDVLDEVCCGQQQQQQPSRSLQAEKLLACLRPLVPRYYSISSSQSAGATSVCCTVAVVRYESSPVASRGRLRSQQRSGLCSAFLQDRCAVGTLCPVFVSENPNFRLPAKDDVPVILIGPGTGIAPFMAFLQERAARQLKSTAVLYYGCRYRAKDFVYKEQLERWQSEGLVHLRLAFSRDSEHDGGSKTYVQHLLAQDSASVWQLLQNGAHVYVCGDARAMAPDVHRTLLTIVQEQAGHNTEAAAAERYLSQLEQLGRYQRDVWVT